MHVQKKKHTTVSRLGASSVQKKRKKMGKNDCKVHALLLLLFLNIKKKGSFYEALKQLYAKFILAA